jgi:hypothetical protein
MPEIEANYPINFGSSWREFQKSEERRKAAVNRFRQMVGSRYHLSTNQLHQIRARLCHEDILADYLHIRTRYNDPIAPPLRTGLARVSLHTCSCGHQASALNCVSDPDFLRKVDDTFPDLVDNHSQADHERDLRGPRCPQAWHIHALTRVNILEIIEPEDNRYHNHLQWVRGTIDGKTVFVHAHGLRNTIH